MKAYIFVRATPAILAATGGSGLKPPPCGRGENGRLAQPPMIIGGLIGYQDPR